MNQAAVWAGYTKEERAARSQAISAGKLKGWAKRKAPRALCRLCGKETRSAHGKYCSKKCQHGDVANWIKGPPRLPRRICPVCGQENKNPRDVHCSRACCVADPSYRKAHLPWLLEGQKIAQEPEVKEKAAKKMRGREQTALLTAKGPEHAKAREYAFRSPEGIIYEGRNVRDFVRTHEDLFDPADVIWKPFRSRPGGLPLEQCNAAKGLASLYGVSRHVRFSWKDWTILK